MSRPSLADDPGIVYAYREVRGGTEGPMTGDKDKTVPIHQDRTVPAARPETPDPASADTPTLITGAAGKQPGSPYPAAPPGYEIIGIISKGGQGVVYKARQAKPSRIVALKMLVQGVHATEVEKSRFLREANAAALLKHPGIVPIFQVGEHERQYFFSMEYVEGLPLDRHLSRAKPDAQGKVLLFLQVCDAVVHAHIHNVVHRDLKPSNIMVDANGHCRLLDFGLAKLEEPDNQRRDTVSGVLMGTFAYMSPEQTQGTPGAVDSRSDVYSLGVILYQMMTGHMPYPVDLPDPFAIVHNIRTIQPTRPSSYVTALRGDLETILLKALAKEKERRYQAVADLARDIRHFLKNEPIEARPSSAWYRARKTVQRHKAVSAFLLILALGFLVAFVWINHLRNAAERERDKAVREWYTAQIGLAGNRVAERDYDVAEELLNACPPYLRNWEWGRTRFLCRLALSTIRTGEAPIRCVAFSPDGRLIASGADDGSLEVHEADSGRRLLSFQAHSGITFSLAFSPDGARIASCGGEIKKKGELKLWDARNGSSLASARAGVDALSSLAFSPDGRRLATAGWDRTVRIWDETLAQPVRVLEGHSAPVTAVAFYPDGKRLASGSWDNTLKVWNVETGREAFSLKGDSSVVYAVALSPDGRRIASGNAKGAIKFWTAQDGTALASLQGHCGMVMSLAFSLDGGRLASAGTDMLVKTWDSRDGRELLALGGHSGWVNSVRFGPDGRRLASGSDDGAVKLWDANTNRETLALEGHTDRVQSIAFSPDGKILASAGCDGTARIWDFHQARELATIKREGLVLSAAFSPDGKRLALAGGSSGEAGELVLWDVETGKELNAFAESAIVTAVAFSPDGGRLVSGDQDGLVCLRDASTGLKLAGLQGHSDAISSVAFSADGRRIVSANRDQGVKVWDAANGRELFALRGLAFPVWSAAFSPDGRRIVCGGGKGGSPGELRICDSADGRTLAALKGHADIVLSVAFSPDGKRIASGSADRIVRIWDVETTREIMSLKKHASMVLSVAFSHDGRTLASAGGDNQIILWQTLDWR